MKIAIPKERRAGEARVAASPDTVKKLLELPLDKLEVAVESGAGAAASIPDRQFEKAGAKLAKGYEACVKDADVVLKVRRPILKGEAGAQDELAALKKGAKLIGMLEPWQAGDSLKAYCAAGVDAFAMEFIPRITRAQAMDVLSSQANLAGYRAVIDAAGEFKRGFPMMMTAAGTVPPARVLVMGAGVAGLQAVATARRLGGVVSATDVRPAAKEQVESLGASFLAVEDEEFKQAEAAGGYAKEMSAAYKKKQAELIAETIKKQDIVVTTALIPGKPAPKLVTAEMVKSMKPGSVIVDLAVEQGGNCELSERGEVVEKHGVTIVGYDNWPSRIAVSAGSLYARNLFSFLQLLVDKDNKQLAVNMDDEIVKGTCIVKDGKVVHPDLSGKAGAASSGSAAAGKSAGAKAKSAAGKSKTAKSKTAKSATTKTTGSKATAGSGPAKKSAGAKSTASKSAGGKSPRSARSKSSGSGSAKSSGGAGGGSGGGSQGQGS